MISPVSVHCISISKSVCYFYQDLSISCLSTPTTDLILPDNRELISDKQTRLLLLNKSLHKKRDSESRDIKQNLTNVQFF